MGVCKDGGEVQLKEGRTYTLYPLKHNSGVDKVEAMAVVQTGKGRREILGDGKENGPD